jgi:hypothetical protein
MKASENAPQSFPNQRRGVGNQDFAHERISTKRAFFFVIEVEQRQRDPGDEVLAELSRGAIQIAWARRAERNLVRP